MNLLGSAAAAAAPRKLDFGHGLCIPQDVTLLVGRPGPAAGAGAATPRGSVRRADPRQERAATRRMCLGARVHSIRQCSSLSRCSAMEMDASVERPEVEVVV